MRSRRHESREKRQRRNERTREFFEGLGQSMRRRREDAVKSGQAGEQSHLAWPSRACAPHGVVRLHTSLAYHQRIMLATFVSTGLQHRLQSRDFLVGFLLSGTGVNTGVSCQASSAEQPVVA